MHRSTFQDCGRRDFIPVRENRTKAGIFGARNSISH